MDRSLLPVVTFFMLMHPENALLPIAPTLSGSPTLFICSFSMKASLPMDVTACPSSSPGTVMSLPLPEYPVISTVPSAFTV